MLRVCMSSARPGMVLALPVYHPSRHDRLLLKAGVVLDRRSIARLRELALREVWIDYPRTDFVAQYISPEVFRAQARLSREVAETFDAVARGAAARLDYSAYRAAVAALLDRLVQNPRSAVFIQEMIDRDRPALRHASTTCFIALLMGLKLENYLIHERSRLRPHAARDVTNLGVGAMLHDIGMLRLDPDTLMRWNQSQDEDDAAWQEHVHLGYELVRGSVEPSAAAVVRHHHQHFDGSGFPRRKAPNGRWMGQAGSEIHIFARITTAADLFDRLRSPPAGPPRSTVAALKLLLQPPRAHWLDPMVVKALLAVVPPYPPGTVVTLSDGREAIVREWFPHDPCRPMVEPVGTLNHGLRDTGERERISLLERPDLRIVHADGFDVADDNFYPSRPGQFDLDMAMRSLFNQAPGAGAGERRRVG